MKMMLYVFLVGFNILIYSCSGVTTTGNNGNIMAYLNVPELSQRIAAKVSATGKNIEVKAFLYKQDDPYKAVDSLEVSGQEYFNFKNLEYGKYAIRVDVDGEQGGLYENIEVQSDEQVVIKIIVNIYIIQNFYIGLSEAEVLALLSKFEAAMLVRSGDTVYVKTLQEYAQDTVFVINGKDTLVSTKIYSSSSESSSSEIFIPKLDTITTEFTLNDTNSIDAQISLIPTSSDRNFGALNSYAFQQYDKSSPSRSLIQFNLPNETLGKKILVSTLTLKSCSWTVKSNKNTPIKIDVHKVLKSWKEGSGTSNTYNSELVDGVTANERSWGALWNSSGLGLDDEDASTDSYSTANMIPKDLTTTNSENESIIFDILKLVQEWSANENDNFGLLIKSQIENLVEANVSNYATWCSSEESVVANRPLIKIVYEK